MSQPFIGEIRMFGASYAPHGWALCVGQIMPIMENPALFSILGNTCGSDGRTTLALPDLRGRVPVNSGQGIGLSNHTIGEKGGSENVTLSTALQGMFPSRA